MGIPVFVKHVHKKTGIPIFMADIEIVTPLMAPFFICRSPYRSNTHPRIATRWHTLEFHLASPRIHTFKQQRESRFL